MVKLTKTIVREPERLDSYLKESRTEPPGFTAESPLNLPKLPTGIEKAREEVIRATKELGDLVTGPAESVRWMAWDHNNSLSLHAIYHYQIEKSFPIDSTATFAEIARKVALSELNVRRFLRHAMTNRIFCEPSSGIVAPTAASRVLAQDAAMDAWLGFCVEDMWPAVSRTVDAIELYPSASEPTQAGLCVANDIVNSEAMFVTFGKSPSRARRTGGAMTSLTGGMVMKSMDGTVVDIGGSHGLRFVVQDLPKTTSSAPELDANIKDRIKFQAHDFHTQQPVKGADVYFFRWILHNHSDKYAVNMLRQLIPALKRGARVVINDHCLPEPGQESLWDEKIIRTMDLVMLTLLNAQERMAGDFEELFKEADPGFKFLGVARPEGCRMSIVEAV
ncbi:S-adenosyl-L-methionine-dependent methyltransferase [Bisporella sp. PMI_857]|nr:S-adenosyl-L-methionine-dependent methyltransferase [Bisporella sp. PMI_857]